MTGLVANGGGRLRVLRRQRRAVVHNPRQGKPLKEGETVARLAEYAAYVYISAPALGGKLLAAPGRQPVT